MNKTHIRSYTVNNASDLDVIAYKGGDRVDLGKHYLDIESPRRGEMRVDAHIDVFRYDDGQLAWTGTPNGTDPPAAMSMELLMRVFLQDIQRTDANDPRAF